MLSDVRIVTTDVLMWAINDVWTQDWSFATVLLSKFVEITLKYQGLARSLILNSVIRSTKALKIPTTCLNVSNFCSIDNSRYSLLRAIGAYRANRTFTGPLI